MKNNKLKIEGTYGDKVDLYLDGFIYTKYGDFLKIRSVDIENKSVDTYFEGSYDFSRVSCCGKNSEPSKKEYINFLTSKLHSNGFRINSVLEYNKQLLKIENIILPNMFDVFEPMLVISVKTDEHDTTSKSVMVINDWTKFISEYKVIHVEYSLEEKISKIISNNTRGLNSIEIDKATKELIDLFETEHEARK